MKNFAAVVFLALLFAGTETLLAQMPVLTLPNSGNTETFDGMGTGTALPNGWQITRSPNSYREVTPWAASSGHLFYNVEQVVSGYPIAPGSNVRFNCYSTSDGTDRAVGLRSRPNAYSQSVMVKCTNTGPAAITKITLSYDIEKYRFDTNIDGTTVKLFYTLNPLATFSETATDPYTQWVGIDESAVHFFKDNTSTNPSQNYPLPIGDGEIWAMDPLDNTYKWMPITTPTADVLQITAVLEGFTLMNNADIYFAVNFSIGDPTNSGGNNAQNSQIYALDNFTIDEVLPVELVSFSGLYRDGTVKLQWRTATEANNYGFEIERSMDLDTWQNVGFVEGIGTVNSPRGYSYTDAADFAGLPVVHYRLRQIDRDGSFDYSPVVSVSLSGETFLTLKNFPNPFNPSTNLNFSLSSAENVLLTITDAAGREVARLLDHSAMSAGAHSVLFDASRLGSGVYFAHLITSSGIATHKLVLSR